MTQNEIREVIKLINSYWKFDSDQCHASSWHDKQDLIKEVEKLGDFITVYDMDGKVIDKQPIDCDTLLMPE